MVEIIAPSSSGSIKASKYLGLSHALIAVCTSLFPLVDSSLVYPNVHYDEKNGILQRKE